MSTKIWFILNEGQVTGPYDQFEVESKIPPMREPQIWGRGHAEWMTPAKWQVKLKEGSAVAPEKEVPTLWRIRYEGIERGPLAYEEMITTLKDIHDYSTVDVRAENSNTWKEVYSIPKIIEDLGISRRSHPRVPIVGTLVSHDEKGDSTFRVISISEGGIGVNDAQALQIGQHLKCTLKSPNLYVTIDTTCEVVYIGRAGYAGLRFAGLPDEFKNSIIEYVNKFATL